MLTRALQSRLAGLARRPTTARWFLSSEAASTLAPPKGLWADPAADAAAAASATAAAQAELAATAAKSSPGVLEIRAEYRCEETETGSVASGALRDAGMLPCLLYGVGAGAAEGQREKVLLKVSTRDIAAELRRRRWAFENTLYDLVLPDGSRQRVVPHQLQRHPITFGMYGLSFLRFSSRTRRKLWVRFTNEDDSPALRRGGFIVRVNHTIMCGFDVEGDGGPDPEIAGAIMPAYLDINVSEVKVGHKLRLSDIKMPPWVYPYRAQPETVIAVVQGSKRDEVKERAAAAKAGG